MKEQIQMIETKWLAMSDEQRAKSIRGHIVNDHLKIQVLNCGIPNFDLEQCLHYRIDANWIVKKIVERLKWNEIDFEVQKNKESVAKELSVTLESYKIKLIKTLIAIHYLALATISWDDVRKIYPSIDSISLNFILDTYEQSFFVTKYGVKPIWQDINLILNITSKTISQTNALASLNKQIANKSQTPSTDTAAQVKSEINNPSSAQVSKDMQDCIKLFLQRRQFVSNNRFHPYVPPQTASMSRKINESAESLRLNK